MIFFKVLFQPPISMNNKPKYLSNSSSHKGALPISSNIGKLISSK